jgi:DNA-binding transcriptional LysR family regulator
MLEQIRSFLTVLEEGNLHRAAARLHVSPSALSRPMQALENELGGRLLERMATGVRPTAGGLELAKSMGALLASYDLAMSNTRQVLRGETDQVRIAYLAIAAKQYLSGPLREVRRSHPETVLKLVNLSPGKQIVALRAGEIDIGLTNESGELLAGEFYARKLDEMGSYIALPEQHRLATRDRVHLSDLKGEFCQLGFSRIARHGPAGRGVLQKVWEVSTEISRHGAKRCTAPRVDHQRKRCFYLAGLRQPSFSARRRHSTPGGRGGDLEDSRHLAARQSRWCSEGIAERPVYEGNSQSQRNDRPRCPSLRAANPDLTYKVKRLALKRGYTKIQIATQLGVA